MDVTNSHSIFEFDCCLFLTIELMESFEYEISIYQNWSFNKIFDLVYSIVVIWQL